MHLHVSGVQYLLTFLAMVVLFGTARLLAAGHPDNIVSQGWLTLF